MSGGEARRRNPPPRPAARHRRGRAGFELFYLVPEIERKSSDRERRGRLPPFLREATRSRGAMGRGGERLPRALFVLVLDENRAIYSTARRHAATE